jgi:cytochrome c biogenesis protein CcmG/thiol:disulfide interchange protein DsbE
VSCLRGALARALAVAVAVVAVSCAGSSGSSVSPIPAVNATSAPSLPMDANALPSLDAAAFASLLGELEGTPVVVNFWASWCSPCRAEAPLLRDAHARYGHEVQFLGVDTQDSRDGAERFIQDEGLTYPSFFDPANAIGLSYDLASPPMTLFFDRNGTLVATVPGEIFDQTLRKNLRAVTASPD